MKYKIKQKLLSFTDSFSIEDESGNEAFYVKGKFFSFSSRQRLYDKNGTELVSIKRKYLSFLPACRIINKDGSEWLVKKCFWPFWTSRFKVSTALGTLEVKGNFWQHEYDIRSNNKVLTTISKKWFSWTDTYGVAILEQSLTAQLLATVIVIDRMQHNERNSNT